jgi:fumarate hydratase subunit beta
MEIHLSTPLTEEKAVALRAGDVVLLSGTLYSARDAAHQKMQDLLKSGQPLPFDLRDAILYYVGPTPTKAGNVVGSAGPTTSGRMDIYTPLLLELGLRGMIGKGERSQSVIDAIVKNKSVYFAAIGGMAAVIAHCIKNVEIVAYHELGPEAVRKITVENFPVIVAIDSEGNDYYQLGQQTYLKQIEGDES